MVCIQEIMIYKKLLHNNNDIRCFAVKFKYKYIMGFVLFQNPGRAVLHHIMGFVLFQNPGCAVLQDLLPGYREAGELSSLCYNECSDKPSCNTCLCSNECLDKPPVIPV